MILNELTGAVLASAQQAIGDGPVVMVNHLWFRDTALYPTGFADPRPTARDAYYGAYAGAIRAVAGDLGVSMQLIYAGERVAGLLVGPDEDWDEIVLVRYESFAEFRAIVESDAYRETAAPHRLAAIANWRFFATRAK